jgi:hypothetical protein
MKYVEVGLDRTEEGSWFLTEETHFKAHSFGIFILFAKQACPYSFAPTAA